MTTQNTATVNMADVKADPIAWAKKGNKLSYGDVRELRSDAGLNIRFRKGAEFYGVNCPVDTLDIPSLKLSVVDLGGIMEPILVSVRPDSSKFVLRGNRRAITGQEIVADPTTSPELFKALTERTPMILLHGLTPDQEKELVNDQTQKSFLRSEVVRNIFDLRKAKWSYERIVMQHYEAMGRFTGNAKKLAEIRELVDPTAKRAKIMQWLRGTLDNYLIWGYDLGAFVQKAIMLSCMKTDGLLPENAEQPYFNAEKNSQKRIAALRKAAQADGTKHNPFVPQEGSEFKKVLDAFHAEDYGTAPVTDKKQSEKMLTRAVLEGMAGSFQSNAVRQTIALVLGKQSPDLGGFDVFAATQESKEMLARQYLPKLKPEVAALVRLVFVNPDPTDFQNFLAANCEEESVPVESPAEEVAVS